MTQEPQPEEKKQQRSSRSLGCDIEETYLGEDRKRYRLERKIASKTDRSKYKKSDQAKWLKKRAEQQGSRLPTENLRVGRVLAITTAGMEVASESEEGRWQCHLRGLLKKEKTREKNLVAVGDFVRFSEIAPGEGVIEQVEKRHTVLARAENLDRRRQQIIAANIDQVLITLSVVIPPLKIALADRYIIATRKGGMEPVIVINKIDLLAGDEVAVQIEKEIYAAFLEALQPTAIPVISVSVETGEGLEDLKQVMQGKASVFSGPSGVGKSSLINALTGLDLPIGDPVLKTKKGSHTTTTARLIPLAFGGWCIDTPGIKSFGVWELESDEIRGYFTDIQTVSQGCSFPDCSHLHEAGCAVKAAVEEGRISPLRYESYSALMESVDKKHRRR